MPHRFETSFLLSCLTTLSLLFVSHSQTATAQVLYKNDFDQHTQSGPYTDEELDADWNEPFWNNGVTEGRTSIVTGSTAYGGSGSCLAVHYPADEHGTSGTGAQWQLRLGDDYEEMYLSYRIKFENGFDFVRGGKLPGLAGGSAPTGSTPATGTNGWAGRMMWRTEFQGDSGDPEQRVCQAISYAKHMDSGFAMDGVQEDKEYWVGANKSRSTLKSGVWYQITQRVKMNNPIAANGIIQIWLDGELVIDRKNIRFRTTDQIAIDMMYFSTFFGGGSSWATSKDETVYFDDFVVSVPESRFHRVPQNYPTIEQAMDAAAPGDTVTFSDTQIANVVVDKPITFRGFAGSRLLPADPSQPAITVNFSEVELKRIQIENALFGVKVDGGKTNVQMDDITTIDGVHGFFVGNNCHGTKIQGCRSFENMGNGFLITPSDDVQIDDCIAISNGGHGFVLFGDSIAFTGNLSNTNAGHGVVVNGDSHFFSENVARFNLLHGYFVRGDNHTFSQNDARKNSFDGFSFSASSNSNCFDNVSRTNDRSGYRWTTGSNNNTVIGCESVANVKQGYTVDIATGNFLNASTASNNSSVGFWLAPRSSGNTVTGNTATGNRLDGFRDNGTNNSVSNNTSDDGT